MIDKTVPNNIEAEQAVFGCALIDPRAFDVIAAELAEDEFYLQKHRWLYAAMQRIHARNDPLDFLTVITALEDAGKLEAVGGAAYVSQLIGAVPSAINAEAYVSIVKNTAARRRLLEAISEVARLAYNEDMPIADVLGQSESLVFKARGNAGMSRPEAVSGIASEIMREIEAAQQAGKSLEFDTGYADLDKIYKLRPGELTIIAARPGIGKTSLMTNIAQRVAYAGRAVLFFSLEMKARDLVHRLVVSEGKVKLEELSSAVFPDSQWTHIVDGLAQVSDLPLFIDDTAENTPSKIRAQVLRMASEREVGLVCVDYVQLMKFEGKVEKRYIAVGEMNRALKALAKDVNIPVLAAAQLGRQAENTRPTLADLRESGDLEQDSDNVILIHRAREINGPSEVEVIVAKRRQGRTGSVKMVWIPERVSFLPEARR